jgi:hypothetical protein
MTDPSKQTTKQIRRRDDGGVIISLNSVGKWIAGITSALLIAVLLGAGAMLIAHEGRISQLETQSDNAAELLKEIRNDIKRLLSQGVPR